MKQPDTTEVVELLKSYAICKTQINAHKYAETYFNPNDEIFEEPNIEECQSRMKIIKILIESFAPSNIATILRLHYINGIPVEKCAECMAISRAAGYRLMAKAHVAVNNRYQRIKEKNDERN